MFNLTKDGHWEADTTTTLQDNIEEFILLHTEDVIDYLNTRSEKEVNDFWQFIFDGSGRYDIQSREKFKKLFYKINKLNKKQGQLLREKFQKMYGVMF